MKTRLMVSVLATVSGLAAAMGAASAVAQEVGKVISATPVLKRVTEPSSTCTGDAEGKQRCTTQMVTEDRQIGYKVVYEYAGRQHTVQLPFAPGATIPLDVSVSVQGAAPAPSPAYPSSYAPAPVEERTYVERYVREPVYVEPAYYPSRYYGYPGYYYDPLFPILGLAVGYSFGSWGHGWRGGHGGWGHGGFRHR